MSLVVEKTAGGREYKVKDMSQADFGRLEIELAEVEMPGLMAYRVEFGPSQPFKGAKITGSFHMTIQTAVLIETLTALGADVRWCSSNIFSTQDHAAAAIARDSAAVFAWKGQTLQEHWWCTEKALDWGPCGGPDLIIDDGGNATLLIHEGVKAEEIYEQTDQLPDPSSTDNAEFQIVLTIIRDSLKVDPKKYTKLKERLVGVSEETTNRIKRLYQMEETALHGIKAEQGLQMEQILHLKEAEVGLQMEETLAFRPIEVERTLHRMESEMGLQTLIHDLLEAVVAQKRAETSRMREEWAEMEAAVEARGNELEFLKTDRDRCIAEQLLLQDAEQVFYEILFPSK